LVRIQPLMPLSASPLHTPQSSRSLDDITDLEAVMGVVEGRREMFEVIVRRYNPRLYRVGMAYLRNHAQAEDAMQNTYLKAFLNLKQFTGTAAFSTWLTRIMINECLMLIRSQKRFSSETLDTAGPEYEAPEEPVVNRLDAEDVKTLLEQSISTLPQSFRAVYLLREVQHLSTAETAECLGLSEANVKVTLHRAREALKAQLLKTAEGVELFDYAAPQCDPMTAKVMAAVFAVGREVGGTAKVGCP
jgi:RNA polymerase sigma factor (sigma-70 family)